MKHLLYIYLTLLVFYAPLVTFKNHETFKKDLRRRNLSLSLQVVAYVLIFLIGLFLAPLSVLFLPYIRLVKQLMGKSDDI
jgi:polyferredoxin